MPKPIRLQKKDIIRKYDKIDIAKVNFTTIKSINPPKIVEKKAKTKNLNFGLEAGVSLKNSSWMNKISSKKQFGEYLGFWISQDLFTKKITILLSAKLFNFHSTFNLDANKEDTFLNGYYFTKDNQPLLFQRFNNKHFDSNISLKIVYNWNKTQPYFGILFNKNTYKIQFLVPENKILNKLDNFKSNNTNFGISTGIIFNLNENISLNLEYQSYKIKNITLKNASFNFDIFRSNNTFVERKIGLGILYNFSK